MDLAKGGSEDGTSTPTEKDAGTVPLAPSEQDASTTTPAPTGQAAGTTPDKPTDLKQKGTPEPDRPTTPSSECSSSDEDYTEDEEYVGCSLKWLGLDPDCKRMMDDETKMLAHHERTMANKAVPIFQQAVNEAPKLFTEARTHITAGVYAMREAIVEFDTRLGNILYFACGQGKRKADTDCGKRKRVRKE
jgi:hypothetical protein